jgi:nucleotide-binding universal stress UspA family protein
MTQTGTLVRLDQALLRNSHPPTAGQLAQSLEADRTARIGTIRTVLLHLDDTPSSAARLEFARHVALRRQAVVSAMFVASPARRPLRPALSESAAALLEPMVWWANEAGARSLFDDVVARRGPAMHWLDSGAADAGQNFCRQALYADLLVLGREDPCSAAPVGTPAGFVEATLIDTGRPALIVPTTGAFEIVGRNVVIDWTATPQAIRAVTAALPWLHDAGRVHVLEALDDRGPAGTDELDIEQYLRLHGIDPVMHRHGSGPGAAEALLSLASDVNAELLVMGCCGRNRYRGASRTVLQRMTLPVLMVH